MKKIDIIKIQTLTNEVLSQLKGNTVKWQTLQLESFNLLLAELNEQERLQEQADDNKWKSVFVNFWINIFLAVVATLTIVQYWESRINKNYIEIHFAPRPSED